MHSSVRGVWFRLSSGLVLWGKKSRALLSTSCCSTSAESSLPSVDPSGVWDMTASSSTSSSSPAPLLEEKIPLPSTCEYHTGPSPRCNDCVSGILICSSHFVPCGALVDFDCHFCKRVLCWKHEDCFCAASRARRAAVARSQLTTQHNNTTSRITKS